MDPRLRGFRRFRSGRAEATPVPVGLSTAANGPSVLVDPRPRAAEILGRAIKKPVGGTDWLQGQGFAARIP